MPSALKLALEDLLKAQRLSADGPPLRVPVPVVDLMTAMAATQAVLVVVVAIPAGHVRPAWVGQ